MPIEVTDPIGFSWNVGVSAGHIVCDLQPTMDHVGLVSVAEKMTLVMKSVKDFSETAFYIGMGYAFASSIGVPSVDMGNYATAATPSNPALAANVGTETTTPQVNNKKTGKISGSDWQVPAR